MEVQPGCAARTTVKTGFRKSNCDENKAEVSSADTLEQKRPSLLMESQCGDIAERKYESKGRKTIAL